MKTHKTLGTLAAFLISGCSSTPKILPRNEINEPVFHTTHFAGLGARLGQTRFRPEHSEGYGEGIYVDPDYQFDRKVGAWASFSVWPLFWNFLLTGEQYADGSNLKTGKLSLAFHGGVSGLTYSQREEWISGRG